MRKTKYAALFLTLALALQLNIPVFAAESTTATVPVTLTVTNEYRSVDVTVPASLPVQVVNGTVITADNARITNNAKSGSIRVTAVSVKDGAYKVGDYERFSGSKTIALEINGSPTKGAGRLTFPSSAFPAIGAGSSQKLTYNAKVSSDAPNAVNVQAASVIFTISLV